MEPNHTCSASRYTVPQTPTLSAASKTILPPRVLTLLWVPTSYLMCQLTVSLCHLSIASHRANKAKGKGPISSNNASPRPNSSSEMKANNNGYRMKLKSWDPSSSKSNRVSSGGVHHQIQKWRIKVKWKILQIKVQAGKRRSRIRWLRLESRRWLALRNRFRLSTSWEWFSTPNYFRPSLLRQTTLCATKCWTKRKQNKWGGQLKGLKHT